MAVLLVGFDGQSWSGEFSKREQRESTNGVFFLGVLKHQFALVKHKRFDTCV